MCSVVCASACVVSYWLVLYHVQCGYGVRKRICCLVLARLTPCAVRCGVRKRMLLSCGVRCGIVPELSLSFSVYVCGCVCVGAVYVGVVYV